MDPTQSPEPADPFVATIQSRGLRVLERLGETPAGLVYRAQYSSSGPVVAVLLLNPMAGSRRRFATPRPPSEVLDQLQHASRIRHQNVAGVREIGETADGLVYAVMDAVPGKPLHEVVSARGALPVREAVDLTLQAAAGLRAAHAAAVVHGNLSPETLVVSEGSDGHALVKLVGFASAPGHLGFSGPGSNPGFDGFVTPEQAAGGVPDKSGDVYSLAAVLHYMLTGEPPGKNPVPRSVPKSIRSVLHHALAKGPLERFHTVQEFGDALQEAMAGLPSPGARARQVATIGVALVVLTLLAWLGWIVAPKVGAKLAALGSLARKEFVAQSGGRHELPSTPESRRRTQASDSVLETANAPSRRKPESGALRGADRDGAPGDDEAPPARNPSPAKPRSSPRAESTPKAATAPDVALSPFRRAHPWAALPEGRYYFRSSCPLALEAPELIYFGSEAEAQSTGREKSTVPGCF